MENQKAQSKKARKVPKKLIWVCVIIVAICIALRPTVASESAHDTENQEVVTETVELAPQGGSGNISTVSLTGIEFTAPPVYEGHDVTSKDLTVTLIFSNGEEQELTTYTLMSTVAMHEKTTVEIKTDYGTFEWDVPVIPVEVVFVKFDSAPYGGVAASTDKFDYWIRYANGEVKRNGRKPCSLIWIIWTNGLESLLRRMRTTNGKRTHQSLLMQEKITCNKNDFYYFAF